MENIFSVDKTWQDYCETNGLPENTLLKIFQMQNSRYLSHHDLMLQIMQLSDSELKKYLKLLLTFQNLPMDNRLLDTRSSICRTTLGLLLQEMSPKYIEEPLSALFESPVLLEEEMPQELKLAPQTLLLWDEYRNIEVLVLYDWKTVYLLRTDFSEFLPPWEVFNAISNVFVSFDQHLLFAVYNGIGKYAPSGEPIWKTELWDRDADDFIDESGPATHPVELADGRIIVSLYRHIFFVDGNTGEIIQRVRMDGRIANSFAMGDTFAYLLYNKLYQFGNDQPLLRVKSDMYVTQSRDQKWLLAPDTWGTQVFDLEQNNEYGEIERGEAHCVFSNNSQTIAAFTSSAILIYDLKTRSLVHRLILPKQEFGKLYINSVSLVFLRDDETVVATAKRIEIRSGLNRKETDLILKWKMNPFQDKHRALMSGLEIPDRERDVAYDLMQRIKLH